MDAEAPATIVAVELGMDEAQGLLEELQAVLEEHAPAAPRMLELRNGLARALLDEGVATVEGG